MYSSLGGLTLPIQVQRVIRGHLDARPAGEDWILFGAATAKQQILHAINLVELGRMHVPIEDNDVQVFRVGCKNLMGILNSGMGPMPERQKAGA